MNIKTVLASLLGWSALALVSSSQADIESVVVFGLENAVDACTAPATTQQAFCQKANDYLFWDGQHPSKAGHRALADYALENLQID